jgi:hypothetical protein
MAKNRQEDRREKLHEEARLELTKARQEFDKAQQVYEQRLRTIDWVLAVEEKSESSDLANNGDTPGKPPRKKRSPKTMKAIENAICHFDGQDFTMRQIEEQVAKDGHNFVYSTIKKAFLELMDRKFVQVTQKGGGSKAKMFRRVI